MVSSYPEYFLESYCSNKVTTNHVATEHLQCGWCYIAGTGLLILLISTNLYLNSYAWLMAIVLDRAASPESVSSEWAGSGSDLSIPMSSVV